MGQAGERFKTALYASHRPGKYLQGKADEKEAAANLKNAERLRAEGMDLAEQLNWEPDYVSDIMPAYRKAQSPISRAFLESILTGANPSMVSSTRHGANRLRAGAQAGFDQQFGGWDQLLARQRAADQAMPWQPGKFSAPAVQKLPPPPAPPPEPAWKTAVRADPNGQTPEGVAALQEMWGITPEYLQQVEDGTQKLNEKLPPFLRRGG